MCNFTDFNCLSWLTVVPTLVDSKMWPLRPHIRHVGQTFWHRRMEYWVVKDKILCEVSCHTYGRMYKAL